MAEFTSFDVKTWIAILMQAPYITFVCVLVGMMVGLFICLFSNMHVYYFRYRDQDAMGRIFQAVSRYHFRLSQGVSDKKSREMRKCCPRKSICIHTDYPSLILVSVGFYRIQVCIFFHKENQNFKTQIFLVP